MMISSKSSNKSKIMKIITAPVRALSKARDLYVKSLINYANHGRMPVGYGPGGGGNNLPRSFSSSSYGFQHGEEDLRELIRANSSRGTSSGNVGTCYIDQQQMRQRQRQQQHQKSTMGSKSSSSQRFSVGLKRIDEDKSFVSKEDFGTGVNRKSSNASN